MNHVTLFRCLRCTSCILHFKPNTSLRTVLQKLPSNFYVNTLIIKMNDFINETRASLFVTLLTILLYVNLQVYNGLDIVTAKVTNEERAMATHHMLDVVDPLILDFTVTQFRDMTLPIVISPLFSACIYVSFLPSSMYRSYLTTPNGPSLTDSRLSLGLVASPMQSQKKQLQCYSTTNTMISQSRNN